ncbi:MAG TPA: histidinol-phosphate transaminase [bacterium]|nr:histidinol-phosphate transaminase [bacterium]HPN45353.1 histidinol-phosphate transaminase [bacterium]
MENYFKKAVTAMQGYESPPQKEYLAKLNQNENPADVPQTIKDELCERAKKLEWNRYPVNTSPLLREKLAARHQVKAGQILTGNGSNQILQTLYSAVIEPGDTIIYCAPTFSLYEMFNELYGAKLIKVLQPPGTPFPIVELLQAIKQHHPRLVILCSPNNPTGFEMDMEQVSQVCAAAPGLVFFDEAYGEFCERSAIELLPEYPNLLISRTFSKAFSLAGLRFGYFIAAAGIIAQLVKVNIPYNINLFTELVACRLLDDPGLMLQQIERLKVEREWLYQQMQACKFIRVFPSSANFLLFHTPKDVNLFIELKKRGILVRDVSSYDLLQGYQRVSIGSRQENELFLEKLQDIFKDEK